MSNSSNKNNALVERESLADIFKYLDKNYKNFIQAQKGSEFEDRIVKLLDISSFVKLNSINKKETINDIQIY
ncbi:hypothetical protein JIY74_30530 [Vibrio harveyi]|nr:hypothetical protein [Vibrio harveyi]